MPDRPVSERLVHEGETLMPLPTTEALQQSNILVLRQMSEAQDRVAKAVDKLADKVDSVQTDVTAMKAQNAMAAVEKLDAKVERYATECETSQAKTESLLERYKAEQVVLSTAHQVQLEALRLESARWKGIFLPVSIMAAGATSAFGAWLITRMVSGG